MTLPVHPVRDPRRRRDRADHARPARTRNAQNRGLLVELDDAFLEAEADDNVRVVILGGNGPMFSSGHDIGARRSSRRSMPGPNQHPTRTINGGTREGAENLMLQEWHYFFQNTLRWRNLRKITIAQVHGARVRRRPDADVGVRPDRRGRGHDLRRRRRHPPRHVRRRVLRAPVGVRRRARPRSSCSPATRSTSRRRYRLGMVSKVFPHDELAERTLEFARRIAKLPTMTALLIKESVNQTVDNMGFYNSLQRVLHPARAQPLALGRGPRRRLRRPPAPRTAWRPGRGAARPATDQAPPRRGGSGMTVVTDLTLVLREGMVGHPAHGRTPVRLAGTLDHAMYRHTDRRNPYDGERLSFANEQWVLNGDTGTDMDSVWHADPRLEPPPIGCRWTGYGEAIWLDCSAAEGPGRRSRRRSWRTPSGVRGPPSAVGTSSWSTPGGPGTSTPTPRPTSPGTWD